MTNTLPDSYTNTKIIMTKEDIKKISLGYKIVVIVGRKVKLKKPEGKNV